MADNIDLARYQELCKKRGRPCLRLGNNLWTLYQKMVVPIGAVNQDYSLAGDEVQALLKYFKGAVLVRATSGFVPSPGEWHCVIVDKFLPYEEISSDRRRKIKNGLRECVVEKIDASLMKKEGWMVYAEAFKRYKHTRLAMNAAQFQKDIVHEGFEDIINYFGVFERSSGRLIGYSQTFLYGQTEVNCGDTRFHPDYLRLYSSYALFYERNRYYLKEGGSFFINNGFRSILHETGVQDLLVKYFNFRRQPVALKLYYRPWVKTIMTMAYPLRNGLGRFFSPVAALYEQDRMGRTQ